MAEEFILIPKSRIAVLIGTKGADRRKIEKKAKVKIKVSSKTGNVQITSENPLDAWVAKEVVEAVGRGFPPIDAIKIINDEIAFGLVNLEAFGAKDRKKRATLRARIIGTRGKTRKIIENYTGTKIVIQGKTAAIIGESIGVDLARKAIEMILDGSGQNTAYKWLLDQTKK